MDQAETRHGGRLRPGYTVLDGDPALPFQKGHSPHFRPMSAVWIKTPLVTEVNLGPGDIMLDGNPAPSEKRGTATGTATATFRPMSIVAKRPDGFGYYLVRR